MPASSSRLIFGLHWVLGKSAQRRCEVLEDGLDKFGGESDVLISSAHGVDFLHRCNLSTTLAIRIPLLPLELVGPIWNPAVENQAVDRIYRLGQTKPVQTIRFMSVGRTLSKAELAKQRLQDVRDLLA
ncbi:hypothetical protein JCM10207_006314 [Rhodosporidiobolus poonsookiae]